MAQPQPGDPDSLVQEGREPPRAPPTRQRHDRPQESTRRTNSHRPTGIDPKFRDVLGQDATDRFLVGLLSIAEWAFDPVGTRVAETRDPDDEYLLALARSARVDVLVSGDRDLTDLLISKPPIETPTQFASRWSEL